MDAIAVVRQNLGDGRTPATVSDDTYVSSVVNNHL
jgi:hypothetical protein